MTKFKPSAQVQRRDDKFSDKITTRIWQEKPTIENPYVAEAALCHGYDLLELTKKCRFSEVLYLLFRGELPNAEEAQLFEALMVGFISPGPRHPATRSAMNAGVGKTDPALILPIALSTFSGTYNAAGAVEEAMRFLRKQQRRDVLEVVKECLSQSPEPNAGDWHLVPGFGSTYNSIDILTAKIARHLLTLPGAGKSLKWGTEFATTLQAHGLGWLPVGVMAATLTDLGFQPKAAAGIYQIISSPGLLAHGIELANKPVTAMPFLADEDYIIEEAG